MTAKERYIKTTVCPWCGIADSRSSWFITRWGSKVVSCRGCGCVYISSSFFTVPEKSEGLRNKNADKIIHLSNKPRSYAFYAGHSFIIEENCVRVTVCPWCGSSVSNHQPTIFGKFECKDCGTKYRSDYYSWMVPERSIGSKDENIDEPIKNWNSLSLPLSMCPWCRHPGVGGIGMKKCERCGTNYMPQIIKMHEFCIEARSINLDQSL